MAMNVIGANNRSNYKNWRQQVLLHSESCMEILVITGH